MRLMLPAYLTALASIIFGLWNHDWRTIFAGCLVGILGPLIALRVDEHHERRELDHLWDDDEDLPGSA